MKMGMKEALIFWQNTIRKAVGLPAKFPVKIVRDERAKRYPLLEIKKDGDVGYDIPAVERVVVPAANEKNIRLYREFMERSKELERMGDLVGAEEAHQQALHCLPRAVIPTGIRIEMPNNLWASLEARSSSSQRMLITPDAIIDSGYRGELFGVVFNLGYEDYVIEPGDRVIQIIFHEKTLVRFKEVQRLSPSQRGETGFGSTGR